MTRWSPMRSVGIVWLAGALVVGACGDDGGGGVDAGADTVEAGDTGTGTDADAGPDADADADADADTPGDAPPSPAADADADADADTDADADAFGACASPCDCPQGYDCVDDACTLGIVAVLCCASDGCPADAVC